MEEIWLGLQRAIELIFSADPDVMEATWRSLSISATASVIAAVIALPLGSLIFHNTFPGKRFLISFIHTLFSLPTVLVGLFVFLLFSRSGPLGEFGLLFTPTIMVIGQAVLVTPLILGLVISALSGIDLMAKETAIALGASRWQMGLLLIKEARYAIFTAFILGFGRAISEVGLALMVGGNIRGFTRVLTTAISLETSKGDIELSLALGIILLGIALLINMALSWLQQRGTDVRRRPVE
ncbi:ABC transporter permease [Dehalogenimonas alkenigignens]|uniref:ABC-type tungstate transport system, periplasmic component n=1 Tax=Dehalogenimonas alkenigignens TaxID=1217799 RepID=A0A0W0GJV3_9CHLR|nr:ABC transporter permease [Dehalogenimonas alkenigignens]KTB48845.1 ABC-type tungstate transport system, periplasmic component [Dehalogenimonas alkenigignens]PVV84748.1 ABC transporter permease [Dehalogenimonas alkenigignens]